MAVLHGTEIIQAVSQSQQLRISHTFAYFLHTAMDIPQYQSQSLDYFTVKASSHVEYTMGRWVLWTYIDHIFIRSPYGMSLFADFSIRCQEVLFCAVAQGDVGHT